MLKKNRIIHEQAGIIEYQRKEILKLESNLKKLSDGDLNIDFEISESNDDMRPDRGIFVSISSYIQNLKESLDGILKDTRALSSNMNEGNIDYRMNNEMYRGVFSKICRDINSSVEVISQPLNEAGTVLEKLEKNDYTLEMKGDYNGRFMQFSGNINSLISRLLSVQDAFVRVSNGDLSRLGEFEKSGKRCENDKLMPAAIGMMRAVQDIQDEVERITGEVAKGNVKNERGNPDKFNGGFREIVIGMNTMLDAVT
ncbi:MAG: hypothetical protein PHC91_07740 [Eubacteriales bacterium]|nr:hypothetical protein [Eubacteriales bacterium]